MWELKTVDKGNDIHTILNKLNFQIMELRIMSGNKEGAASVSTRSSIIIIVISSSCD